MKETKPTCEPGKKGLSVHYVALGGLRTDYVITAEGQLFSNQHGGNAIYSAAGMRLWTEKVGIVGRVGSNFPQSWLAEARSAGLDLAGVQRLPTWQETRTFYAYLPNGRRDDKNPACHYARIGRPMPAELEGYTSSTLDFSSPEPNPLSLSLDDLPPSYTQARGIHVAPYDLWTQLHLLPALAELDGMVVTLDPNYGYSSPDYAETICSLLPHADAFLPSELEATGLLEGNSPAEAARHFVRRGARIVVIKLGKDGSLVLAAGQEALWHVPAYPAQIQDLTGAGDSFCGGFLVGYAETGDPVKAVQYGTVSASFVIESRGGLAAIQNARPKFRERLQWLATHRPPQAL